jgi:hypothetical protein
LLRGGEKRGEKGSFDRALGEVDEETTMRTTVYWDEAMPVPQVFGEETERIVAEYLERLREEYDVVMGSAPIDEEAETPPPPGPQTANRVE